MDTREPKSWCEWSVPDANGRTIVMDEHSGRTVAIAYDKKDVPLILTAPKLLDALERAKEHILDLKAEQGDETPAPDFICAAIANAKGEWL